MWTAIAAAAIFSQQYSTTSVMEFASSTAIVYHLNKAHFLATLDCESGFRYDAVGDDGASIGVAQIDLYYHPDITYPEAMNPDIAITWMATQWQRGNADLWSCWRDMMDAHRYSKA